MRRSIGTEKSGKIGRASPSNVCISIRYCWCSLVVQSDLEFVGHYRVSRSCGSFLGRKSTRQRVGKIRRTKTRVGGRVRERERKGEKRARTRRRLFMTITLKPFRGVVEHGAVAASASCFTVEGTARTAAVAEPRRRVRGPRQWRRRSLLNAKPIVNRARALAVQRPPVRAHDIIIIVIVTRVPARRGRVTWRETLPPTPWLKATLKHENNFFFFFTFLSCTYFLFYFFFVSLPVPMSYAEIISRDCTVIYTDRHYGVFSVLYQVAVARLIGHRDAAEYVRWCSAQMCQK